MRGLSATIRGELERLGSECADEKSAVSATELLKELLPPPTGSVGIDDSLEDLLVQYGFDRDLHEQIRADLRSGRIGLAQNRLPPSTLVEDVRSDDIIDVRDEVASEYVQVGEEAIANGQIAVVTLAAGAGSRWTEGAGVVKALDPFCLMAKRHRNFLEVHLAKSRLVGQRFGHDPPHVFTTGYSTDQPIKKHLRHSDNYGYPGELMLSRGMAVGLRTVPMVRDLRFAWDEMPQQILDEQQQKVRESLRSALIHWARQMGEGSNYTDNLPLQCLHPVGHWYEIPNMLRNGVLASLLEKEPGLKYLLLHNVDTLGANIDAGLLGLHIKRDKCLTFEVISRRLDDRGGGLARVNGQVRLLEGLAMPREEDEFELSYYNSMTTWINVDQLLSVFDLSRANLQDKNRVTAAVRKMSQRMPTYITIKDVKKRWGHGQKDIFPVSQFEKLWGDMTAVPDIRCDFLVVPLYRGQQLKQQAQLDGWVRDGSASFVEQMCQWSE